MPDTTVHHATRPATVDIVLLLGALAATVTMVHGSDFLTILITAFLLKTLDTWRPL